MSYPDPRHDGTSYPKTRYFGDTGEVSAWVRRADQPPELDTGSGVRPLPGDRGGDARAVRALPLGQETGPGDYCFVPEGGVHGFRNESDSPASLLILFSPGAPREQYFEGLVEMFQPGREVSDDEFRDFCERHDNIYL